MSRAFSIFFTCQCQGKLGKCGYNAVILSWMEFRLATCTKGVLTVYLELQEQRCEKKIFLGLPLSLLLLAALDDRI